MKKENIKMHIKNLIAPSIMSFVIAFMLFIYEPIITYAANTEDYWFGLKELLLNNLIFFSITLVTLLFISILFYFTAKKSKKEIIYNIYVIIMFVCFTATYIQGNYLASSLPTLDGTPINWNNYTKQGIASIVLWLVLIVTNILLYMKLKVILILMMFKILDFIRCEVAQLMLQLQALIIV